MYTHIHGEYVYIIEYCISNHNSQPSYIIVVSMLYLHLVNIFPDGFYAVTNTELQVIAIKQ